MTLTEALQETKTLKERIHKKRERLIEHVGRIGIVRDPLEKEGGQKNHCARELQAIVDLEKRLLDVRAVISDTNNKTMLTVVEKTMSIEDWLNWRRDVLGPRQKYLTQLLNHLSQLREKIDNDRVKFESQQQKDSVTDYKDYVLIPNVDETELRKELEWLEEVVGALDARLSVANATTSVEME